MTFTEFVVYPALVFYMGMTANQFWRLFHPTACNGPGCLRPVLHPDTLLDLRCFLISDGADAVPLWNVTDVNADEPLDASFPLPVPPGLRTGQLSDLWLLFELRHVGSAEGSPPLAATTVNVVQPYAPRERSAARPLLEDLTITSRSGAEDDGAVATSSASTSVSTDLAPADRQGRHPHFIYGGRFLELRLVTDFTPHFDSHLPDGIPIGGGVDPRARVYTPHFYVEQFSLLRKHAHPLSADLKKRHPTLRLKFKPISLGRHRMTVQISQLFALLEGTLGEALSLESELDEIKELLSDERIYRFMLMQVIGLFHVLFDLLAFRSDIGFWKGRETMSGLSSRSVLSSAAQTLIVYLYLLDAEGVNQIVLLTYTVSVALELWKALKVIAIMRRVKLQAAEARARARAQAQQQQQQQHGQTEAAQPASAYASHAGSAAAAAADGASSPAADASSAAAAAAGIAASEAAAKDATAEARAHEAKVKVEADTERFDQLATRTLGVGLAPLVGGWAIYALVTEQHTSWYSWAVSSLADAVYLFGFIGMTPQLFINYKLKSVAHMPWRVMAYKCFNTFIDDVFAVMVSMPMHHRVACLRDDAVFFVFLYQRWLYPVDKRRANEYGFAYEMDDQDAGGSDANASAGEAAAAGEHESSSASGAQAVALLAD
jgi:hypothetical protein